MYRISLHLVYFYSVFYFFFFLTRGLFCFCIYCFEAFYDGFIYILFLLSLVSHSGLLWEAEQCRNKLKQNSNMLGHLKKLSALKLKWLCDSQILQPIFYCFAQQVYLLQAWSTAAENSVGSLTFLFILSITSWGELSTASHLPETIMFHWLTSHSNSSIAFIKILILTNTF